MDTQRDVWLLAIGAALADPGQRPRLAGMSHAPTFVREARDAIGSGDKALMESWLRRYGVRLQGKAVDCLMSKCERISLKESLRAKAAELGVRVAGGDFDGAREVIESMLEQLPEHSRPECGATAGLPGAGLQRES